MITSLTARLSNRNTTGALVADPDRYVYIPKAPGAANAAVVSVVVNVQEDGSLVIPVEMVQRWERQIATPYPDLTEAERSSDIEQVKRYLPTVIGALE